MWLKILIILLVGLGVTGDAWAVVANATPPAPSLGDMSHNVLGSLVVMTKLLYSICYIIGGAMIAGGGIQYKTYRDNPSQVPISRAIFLLVIGLVFVALPLVCQLSSGAEVVK